MLIFGAAEFLLWQATIGRATNSSERRCSRIAYPTNPQKAIRDHVDNEDKGVNESFTPGGRQKTLVVNVQRAAFPGHHGNGNVQNQLNFQHE